ncbi:rubrerythrin family protein [Clostridium fermenticellae]|uniref:Rubrerythrin family protein n=1 Tax=Clostridium fermenticellae TaxID=2068654 RepID=A0A386H0D2_9CLOT|nr:rubrerythrin family protein [Clostridium fermenticellae]AYD39131.1 rubrerythrin family protein [Clostridium fermenticellae]
MKSLQGTKTADNLAKAFAGESQARNRYTYYGRKADKEGYKKIAAVFLEVADNERAHAKVFFDLLVRGLGKAHIKVDAEYPIGYGDTEQNLQYAAEGEKEEWGTLYPNFADQAKEEGFSEVESAFREIIKIETSHEQIYINLLNNLKSGTLYKRNTTKKWRCRNCGYIFEGTEAPKVCPACKHPQGYFEIMDNIEL